LIYFLSAAFLGLLVLLFSIYRWGKKSEKADRLEAAAEAVDESRKIRDDNRRLSADALRRKLRSGGGVRDIPKDSDDGK